MMSEQKVLNEAVQLLARASDLLSSAGYFHRARDLADIVHDLNALAEQGGAELSSDRAVPAECELIKSVAKALAASESGQIEFYDSMDLLTRSGFQRDARAALGAAAENIEVRFGELHPGALYIRKELAGR